MANIYLNEVEFHNPSETEKKEIKHKQNIIVARVFLIRFIILALLFSIGTVSEILARYSRPWLHEYNNPVDQIVFKFILVFCILNLLSLIQLLLVHKVINRPSDCEVICVKVESKFTVEYLKYTLIRFRKLSISTDYDFILDPVEFHGIINYIFIKPGQMAYIEKIDYDGHYRYKYLA